MQKYFFAILLFSVFSCNKIENHHSLNKEDIVFIKSLGLLEPDENIYKFYSEDTKQTAGNFFTNKRVATYWIDKRNPENNQLKYAFYKDIVKIDTGKRAGATYCPYALITAKDNTKFEVSVDGSNQDIKSFFKDLLIEWKKNTVIK
ncbi:hypothetical protein [Flavobacterium sp. KACC 22761]|uniref:hypothetical protein n=1 Tax=Flavobacterium sp. KACC 22761 TaxID=3092665 RepID=UPI002A74B00F|nr:hypothetical protein [Flavobacterium sp. KACC 22761]WPO77218.1 hypothetical protein SCB73_13190 [Flavobacterium sp. KACC 22761]